MSIPGGTHVDGDGLPGGPGGFGKGGAAALSWFSHGKEAAVVPRALCEGVSLWSTVVGAAQPARGTRPRALGLPEAEGGSSQSWVTAGVPVLQGEDGAAVGCFWVFFFALCLVPV